MKWPVSFFSVSVSFFVVRLSAEITDPAYREPLDLRVIFSIVSTIHSTLKIKYMHSD